MNILYKQQQNPILNQVDLCIKSNNLALKKTNTILIKCIHVYEVVINNNKSNTTQLCNPFTKCIHVVECPSQSLAQMGHFKRATRMSEQNTYCVGTLNSMVMVMPTRLGYLEWDSI